MRLISPLAAEAYMNPMLEAALWFWIPLCFIPVGIWLSISGRTKSLGKGIALFGLILVMVSSWTVPDSDSSAGGHLILSIAAPTLLLAYGIHGMVFGGNVPVGRLDSSARWSGTIAVFVSIGIFCLMHWYSFTPVWRDGDVNPYWIVFWPTFLLFSTSLCSASAVALATYGDDRLNESLKLASLTILMTGIALCAMIFDGYLTTADQFRDYLWLSAADIFGTVVGSSLAIGALAIVIWSYERSLPVPQSSHPPTEKEIEHVVSLAISHIGGEEE